MFLKLFNKKNTKKRIYFDSASATHILEISKKTYLDACKYFANASSIHTEGENTKDILLESRKIVAKYLHARQSNIYFTSSTTEANNIFIKGVILHAKKAGETPHVIYSKADHSSIVDVVESCKIFGTEFDSVVPNKIGRLLVEDILNKIKNNTRLISFSFVSSELGTIQDVKKIVSAVREYCLTNKLNIPKIFIDASQAIKYESVDVSNLLVDGLSFGGSKLGNVPGVAVLYVKSDTKLVPIISGGGQEEGIRSGTENIPAIIALSKTLETLHDRKQQKNQKEYVYGLRNYCIQQLQLSFKDRELEIFGDTKFKYNKFYEYSAPHILLISLVDMIGEETLLRLDAKGISVSTASACSLLENSGSNFLKSINEPIKAKETIRLSFSEQNTKAEIDIFISELIKIKNKFVNK